MYDKLYLSTPSSQDMIQHKQVINVDNFTTMNQRAKVLMNIIGFNSVGSLNNITRDYSRYANPIIRVYERFRPYGISNLTQSSYYALLANARSTVTYTQFPGSVGVGTYNGLSFNNLNGLTNETIQMIDSIALNPILGGFEPNKTVVGGLPDCSICNCNTVKTAHCFVQNNMLPNWGGVVGGSDTALILYSFVLNNFPNSTYAANFSILHQYFSTAYYFQTNSPAGITNLRNFEHRMATMFLNLILLNQWPTSVNNVDPISEAVVESILTTHLNNL